jgi:predicted metal-dependent enzyme (double-stranded beta helix superfamily)
MITTMASGQALADSIAPLRDFVIAATAVADRDLAEPERVEAMRVLLRDLVADDSWLPVSAALPHTEHYQQYLLHCDPQERFSVVSFVWGAGQRTPIHDHTLWGLIGMLRGAEIGQHFRPDAQGFMRPHGAPGRLEQGDVELVSPSTGDVHQVANAYEDRASVSIHVYGGNIGAVARHVFDPVNGVVKPFVSGYSAATVPNLWDRSQSVRAGFAADGGGDRS